MDGLAVRGPRGYEPRELWLTLGDIIPPSYRRRIRAPRIGFALLRKSRSLHFASCGRDAEA